MLKKYLNTRKINNMKINLKELSQKENNPFLKKNFLKFINFFN